MKNLRLTPCQPADFDCFIFWLDNQELLFQIAGTYFTFPVTEDQLHKVIIGDPAMRGKGLGGKLIEALLKYAFAELNATAVELLVFDWNIAGIKCYEKAGFTFADREMPPFEIGRKSWGVKKMEVNKE